MKLDKIRLLAAGLAVIFALMPISAQASAGDVNVYSGEAGTICHCGGTRLVSIVTKIESTDTPCPDNHPNCRYSLCSEMEYFHCSNPYCTDTWYGPVLRTYYIHDHT